MGLSKKFYLVVVTIIAYLSLLAQCGANGGLDSDFLDQEEEILNFLENPHQHSLDIDFRKGWIQRSMVPRYLRNFLQTFRQGELPIPDPEKHFARLFQGVDNVDCKGHILEWIWRYNHLAGDSVNLGSEKEKWVLQMLDAWGKLPEGILSGHVNSHGDFHECVEIEVSDLVVYNKNITRISKSFDGRYCTNYIVVWNPLAVSAADNKVLSQLSEDFRQGVIARGAVGLEELIKRIVSQLPSTIMMLPTVASCMPNSCTTVDIQHILVNAVSMTYDSLPNKPPIFAWPMTTNCLDRSKPDLDAGAISVIVLLAVLIGLSLGAGIVDYFLNRGVEKPPKRGIAYHYFMAFSMYTNTKKWLSTRKGAKDFGCLHGIRTCSTVWVVFAHTYAVAGTAPLWNMVDVKAMYEHWTELSAINGTFSVDTFFVMSGMLATFSLLKMLDKTKGKLNVFLFYLHRYIRLTPTYAILVAIGATLTVYVSNGPMWWKITDAEDLCKKYWWTNLLYVNNLIHTHEMCNGESWYLSNDMQFYILSPLIVYPIWRWEKKGLFGLVVYTILSIVAPILVVHYADAPPAIAVTGRINLKSYGEIYVRPWSRIQTFLVGVWVGWLIYKTRGKTVKLPRFVAPVLWIISTGTAMAVLYGVVPWFDPRNEIPKVGGLFYAGLSRFSWAIVVAWVIFACIKGYGGIVNSFLSWTVFMPLGRLCFCVYLTSLHLQNIFHFRMSQPIRYDTYTLVNLAFAHILMSYIAGYFATLLFESPFMILQRLIFEGPPRPRPPPPAATASGTVKPKEEHQQ